MMSRLVELSFEHPFTAFVLILAIGLSASWVIEAFRVW